MSLVGPRPERPHFVEAFGREVRHYDDRHRVPAGLTGWAQIHGLRGDSSIEQRARFDNEYIEQWSLWRDILILFRTGAAMHRGDKAETEPEVALSAVERAEHAEHIAVHSLAS
jgi:lipopolysaccharide/colanic/teichoic acid biosynthesis glycosyltransferase